MGLISRFPTPQPHQHGILPAGSEAGAEFVAAQSAGHRRERTSQVGGRGRRGCRVLAPVDGPQHQKTTAAGQQQLLFRHAALFSPAAAGVLLRLPAAASRILPARAGFRHADAP
jgi:hypothetical protein